jgi:serine/threonine protein kinase
MVNHGTELPDFVMSTIDDGRFLFLRRIGCGSYGAVYKALDLNSPTDNRAFVAIKCIRKPKASASQAKYLSREIELHRTMSYHPNVVTLHDVIEDEEFVFLVMEFCTGGDMFTAVTETKVYFDNDELIKSTFLDLIDTVHACHEKNVFHRDLKPENILCSEDGTGILLADFGLATTDGMSREFTAGSTSYMSPGAFFSFFGLCLLAHLASIECVGGVALGYSPKHADIWALGVILMTMVTTRYPWMQASQDDKFFYKFLRHPQNLGPDMYISEAASSIFQRIFKMNPLARISLPELREEILKMGTFSRTEADDMPKSRRKSIIPRLRIFGTKGGANGQSPLIPNLDVAVVCSSHVSSIIPLDLTTIATPPPSSVARSDSTDSIESDGPITPETHPVHPDVEISDSDAFELDGGAPTPVIVVPPPVADKKSRRFGGFRNSVMRFKAVSWLV